MPDPFLDALSAVRGAGSGQDDDPFLSALDEVRQPTDTRSRFARAFDWANQSLVPGLGAAATRVGERLSKPTAADTPFTARVKGAIGGVVEGAGNVAGSLLSPFGLATTA